MKKNKGVNYLRRLRNKFASFSSKQITTKEATLCEILSLRLVVINNFMTLIKIMYFDCIICNQLTFIFKCTRIKYFSCKILRSTHVRCLRTIPLIYFKGFVLSTSVWRMCFILFAILKWIDNQKPMYGVYGICVDKCIMIS